MRAINHSLTGAVIGLSISDPLVAAPLAFISHYVLDTVPHFAFNNDKKNPASTSFIARIVIDFVLCSLLVLVLFLNRPIHWVNAILCAFLAALPDFFSINYLYKHLKNKPHKPGLHFRFASKIQWFERPIGIVVETVLFISLVVCLSVFLKH